MENTKRNLTNIKTVVWYSSEIKDKNLDYKRLQHYKSEIATIFKECCMPYDLYVIFNEIENYINYRTELEECYNEHFFAIEDSLTDTKNKILSLDLLEEEQKLQKEFNGLYKTHLENTIFMIDEGNEKF